MDGTKKDDGKLRMDLLSPYSIEGLVGVLTKGAEKYDERNWEKGIKFGRVFAACMRHLLAWWRGEEHDPEDGQHHLDHAAANIHFLSHYVKHYWRYGANFDDRPHRIPRHEDEKGD
jgi:hypothetical protein